MLWKELWFHEDDYARAQFLPLECWDYCREQLDRIRAHDIAHRLPGDVGWTKMYKLPPAPASIVDLSIGKDDLAAAMPWKLWRTNRVLTGSWSGKGERLPRTAAYRTGRSAIVYSWNEDRIVDSLWFKDGYASWWNRRALLAAFFRLGILAPMLLVDWRGALVDLKDRRAIKGYLRNFGGGRLDGEAASEPAETETSASAEAADTAAPPSRPDSLYRFAYPVRPALITRKSADSPMRAVLAGTAGQSWTIDLNETSLNAGSPVAPIPMKVSNDEALIDWIDFADNKIVILRDDDRGERFEVCDVRDSTCLYRTFHASAAVLSPDGRRLLVFEDEGIAVADLDDPAAPVRQSRLFPLARPDVDDDPNRLDITLDNPSSVMAVAAADGDSFTLAIGDYGFAAVAVVRLGGAGEPPLIVTEAARMLSEGLVYDPVEVLDVIPGDSLVVRHGHGCGIARFDLQTGAVAECPLPAEKTEGGYGAFRSAVVAFGSPGLWVNTDIGPYYWSGTAPMKRVSQDARMGLATDGDRTLCVSPDGWDLIRGRLRSPPNAS